MSRISGDRCGPHPPVGWDGRPLPFDPRWRTETVLALARGIDAEVAFDRMPILADALQEAGCDLSEVLDHCRVCERHLPSCWVLGLALARPAAPAVADPERLARVARLRLAAEMAWLDAPAPIKSAAGVPPGVTALLSLGVLAVAGLIAFAPLPADWFPAPDRPIPNPFTVSPLTDTPEWQEAKGRIDASLRTARPAANPPRRGGPNAVSP